MMTREELNREFIDTHCAISLGLVSDGKLQRAVELFLQQMRNRHDTIGLVEGDVRADGLAAVSQGADAVRSWLRRF